MSVQCMFTRNQARFILLVAFLLSLWVLAACGSEKATPDIQIEEVWSRPAMMTGMSSGQDQGGMGAVFMTLRNEGQASDRLMSAQSEVAETVEVHETKLEGDVARMQQVTGGIELPAGEEVKLEPGGYHIMLIGLRHELLPGDRFLVTLMFEKSAQRTVEAQVREP